MIVHVRFNDACRQRWRWQSDAYIWYGPSNQNQHRKKRPNLFDLFISKCKSCAYFWCKTLLKFCDFCFAINANLSRNWISPFDVGQCICIWLKQELSSVIHMSDFVTIVPWIWAKSRLPLSHTDASKVFWICSFIARYISIRVCITTSSTPSFRHINNLSNFCSYTILIHSFSLSHSPLHSYLDTR